MILPLAYFFRGKFEGGDAAWEEKNQGSGYAKSEVRFVEIQEDICKDLDRGETQVRLDIIKVFMRCVARMLLLMLWHGRRRKAKSLDLLHFNQELEYGSSAADVKSTLGNCRRTT